MSFFQQCVLLGAINLISSTQHQSHQLNINIAPYKFTFLTSDLQMLHFELGCHSTTGNIKEIFTKIEVD